MDPQLIKHIDAKMPRFNPVLTNGFHQQEFEKGLAWFDNALASILKPIQARDVYYVETKRASPREFIKYLTENSRKTFDTPKETLYPVKIHIQYKDKAGKMHDFYVFTMLSYADKYGDVWMRGSQYSHQIVLAERGLPVTKENSLFVKVLGFKFKIGIEHFSYCQVFNVGGHVSMRAESINMAANRFYSPTEGRKIKDNKTPTPLLAWYIFANIGFSKAMIEYGECDFEIGPLDVLLDECRTEDRWEILTSPRNASSNKHSLGDFLSLDIAIAVRNKSANRKELSAMGLQYATALLFIVACCSSYFDIERLDDPGYWRLIIGRSSIKAGDSDEYIMRLMNVHFVAINEYLDADSIRKFASQSIVVADMFDLFNYIIANRSEIVQTTDRASALHKELATVEFTFDGLLTAANSFKHDIKNNSEINYKKVLRFLSDNFRIKEIDSARNANLTLEQTPTDCPFIDYGLGCIPQHKVYTNVGKKKRGDFDTSDSATFTHASLPFVHSYLRVDSPNPDGRGYLTPCMYLVNGKLTAVPPKFQSLYDRTDHRLKNREPWPCQSPEEECSNPESQ